MKYEDMKKWKIGDGKGYGGKRTGRVKSGQLQEWDRSKTHFGNENLFALHVPGDLPPSVLPQIGPST